MLHFFQKKKFLVDSLENFIDIHNHILPGIDDGAKNVDDSLILIKGFSDFGVNKFIFTPHVIHNYYPNTPETIEKAFCSLKEALTKTGMDKFNINASAEHMIDANFEHLLENEAIMPLNKKYLLIEMSYLQPSINFKDAILKIAEHHYFPILAHPERYGYLHNNFSKYKKYKKQGILFQLNLLSLSDYYGKEVQKTAIRLMEEGLIDFVASDVHNLHQLTLLKNIKITDKLLTQLLPLIENTNINFD
ncbi:histidinol phosphatase [Arenibacter sp. BSSL-BM3]|uniref:protein-tyrosine-phosphatase n=1 Tax=Arenibacter arenosicollis TaxID=2762274 RepID=A0ABR7QRS1_9FLAO|nr:CpsB/CapC family capsule biosynthesis tyrosine phosphatase [Arenibacter arenosicollis]MBC8769899.1 histidinol phosphatase [Arenibacter arenosicollis]